MAVKPINLQISPESLNQGEQAIRQEIAIQLYTQKVFTFGQARHLANLSVLFRRSDDREQNMKSIKRSL